MFTNMEIIRRPYLEGTPLQYESSRQYLVPHGYIGVDDRVEKMSEGLEMNRCGVNSPTPVD